MQAAVKGKNPKPKGFCWRVPRLAPPGAPPQGVPSLGVLSAPKGRPGPRQDCKESGRIQRQNSKREPILTRSPPVMGQAPPKAKPKNCWRVLCPGSSSEFLFNSPIHGSKGGKTFAGTSCAQAPFQNSFARLLSKGTKKLLACPVPWLLFKIPFSNSFPKRQEHCWRVLCPGSFSGFLFKAPRKLLARPFIPVQKLGKLAGVASLPVLAIQKQTQYITRAPARTSQTRL